jgi:Tfp pilus assembly protein PilN
MIKVNLIGASRKKTKTAGVKFSAPSSVLPIVLALIVFGSALGGYLWYSSVAGRNEDLVTRIAQLEAQRAQLDAIIKQDAVYEERKKSLENRIRIIEGLKRNQVSPVVSLDALSDAINRTEFVWLASLDQNNTVFSMSGTSTSVNALADFVSNLEGTGFFRNINLVNAQDASGNYTFSMTCEFLPPAAPSAQTVLPTPTGGD